MPGFARAFAAPVFNEIAVRVPPATTAARVLEQLAERRVLGGLDLGRFYPELADCILMTATELTTDDEIAALGSALDLIVRENDLVRA